jgi:hypothetical protein
MSDRLYIAAEITRRLNYIRHDTLELARLLRGETLSEGFHENLTAMIRDLQQIADKARPVQPAQVAEPQEPTPPRAERDQPERVLERADAA